VHLLGVHCNNGACSLLGRSSEEVAASGAPGIVIGAILRDGKAFVPRGDDRVLQGDDIYVITETAQVDRVMSFLGHEEQVARRIVIVGGGNVGLSLAQRLARDAPAVSLKIVEHSRERAEFISRELGDDAIVLQGDALDKDVLLEAQVDRAETVIAVTNDDETNIFASVLAKREGCSRAITLVNKSSYESFYQPLASMRS
jgi:trk system potassium uptake protein TrkA